MKCDKCGKEDSTVRYININGQDTEICSNCIKQIDDIHSIGYSSKQTDDIDTSKETTTIYFKVAHPWDFGNAERIKIEYKHADPNTSREEWELVAKLDIVASVMNFERDAHAGYRRFIIDCLKNKSSKYYKDVHKYFDSLIPITKKQFEEKGLKEVWSK